MSKAEEAEVLILQHSLCGENQHCSTQFLREASSSMTMKNVKEKEVEPEKSYFKLSGQQSGKWKEEAVFWLKLES